MYRISIEEQEIKRNPYRQNQCILTTVLYDRIIDEVAKEISEKLLTYKDDDRVIEMDEQGEYAECYGAFYLEFVELFNLGHLKWNWGRGTGFKNNGIYILTLTER